MAPLLGWPWWGLLAAGLSACASGGAVRFTRYPLAEMAQIGNVHLYRGAPVCQACHVDGRAELLQGPVQTCRTCHAARHTPGHEPGAPPGTMVNVSLPLPGGVVVCHTCHDPHDVKKYPRGLRKPVDELCRSCHTKS